MERGKEGINKGGKRQKQKRLHKKEEEKRESLKRGRKVYTQP